MATTQVGEINLLGDFLNPEQEARFRDYALDGSRRILAVVSGIVLFAAVIFLLNDFDNTGIDYNAFLPRLAIGAIAALSLWLTVQIGTRTAVTTATILLVAGVAILNAFIAMSRPPDYLLHLGVDVIILIGIYIIVPTVRLQLLLAIMHTFALINLHFLIKSPSYDMAHLTVPMTLIVANMVGMGMSILYNRTRHQLFAQLEDLRQANESVQKLSQLIPMCAICKSVRNDSGYWEQVETYMKAESGVEVSHGLCPECTENYRSA